MAEPAAVKAYIGLGSNLEEPVKQVARALQELDSVPQTRCLAHSGLYSSGPMGPQDQPDYINAVARVETRLSPRDLLQALQAIERAHGRLRIERWGPRTLDLDLLLYGEGPHREEGLVVPHPGLHERAFVLYPLRELDPELPIPGFGRIDELCARCPRGDLKRLESLHD